jgi:outer membrane protein assembly factor BamB
MELTDRVTRIISLGARGLLAADVTGRLHVLDRDLNLLRSSKALPTAILSSSRPVYTLAVAGGWVVTKDMGGSIAKWSLDTLDLIVHYDAYSLCDRSLLKEDEEPSPVMSRGVTIWGEKVYVNNGYRQLVVLDLESFSIQQIVPSITGDIALENFCTDHPDVHVVSDKGGRLHFGSLDSLEFPIVVKADESNIHRVCWDPRHQRFWLSQDAGHGHNAYRDHGVATATPDGTITQEKHFAGNDVEFVALSPDGTKAYAGGFDGVLHIFDNTSPELRIQRTISGFPHQLIDIALDADGSLYVLTQDGELVKLDADGRALARADFRRQCVWDICASPEDPSTLYVATDDGVAVVNVEETQAGFVSLRVSHHHITGLGFTRRIVAMPDGWLGLTWDRKVFRCSSSGKVRWLRDLPAFGHTIAASPDRTRVLVATNAGGLELSASSGDQLELLVVAAQATAERPMEGEAAAKQATEGLATWAGTYLPSGERVLATRTGHLQAFEPDGIRGTWSLTLDYAEYTKRMFVTDDALYVIGALGMKEIPLGSLKVERRFVELLENTVENGIVFDGTACAITYGGQLAAYDYDSQEPIDLKEDLPDFPKGLAVVRTKDGRPHVVVGGRGGYLSLFSVDTEFGTGRLVKLLDVYLPRPGLKATAALHCDSSNEGVTALGRVTYGTPEHGRFEHGSLERATIANRA